MRQLALPKEVHKSEVPARTSISLKDQVFADSNLGICLSDSDGVVGVFSTRELAIAALVSQLKDPVVVADDMVVVCELDRLLGDN